MSSLRAHQKFQGRYQIRRVLGEGGSATVYHAVDTTSGRDVALKILEPGPNGYRADMAERFRREVRMLARLRNPHSVTMFDHGESDDGLFYLVFEYVPGRDLEELIFGTARLSEDVVRHILDQLLQALVEAHHEGLLHRDIKPANIRVFEYLGDPHHTVLIDFGIAREVAPVDRRVARPDRANDPSRASRAISVCG